MRDEIQASVENSKRFDIEIEEMTHRIDRETRSEGRVTVRSSEFGEDHRGVLLIL
jgi:C4-type Zn-finger protein